MSHIHNHECLQHHHDHHDHEQAQHNHEQVAAHMGSLCCSGQCSHIEHHISTEPMAQINEALMAALHEEEENEPRYKKKKKSKTKNGVASSFITI